MDNSLEHDEEVVKKALKDYLEHFPISDRNEVLETLICDLDKEGLIKIDYVEVW